MTVWATENDLCTAFARAARLSGWDVYPEVSGWDLVLARPERDRPGPPTTIGIQAKLQCSWRVLSQVTRPARQGPDYRAVLVPRRDRDFAGLCTRLGVGLYTGDDSWTGIRPRGEARPRGRNSPLVLPSIPDVGEPGTSSPLQLTPWRERAIVVCHLLLRRGWVSGEDFDRLGVDRKNWTTGEHWIRRDGRRPWVSGKRRTARYVLACAPDQLPDAGYDEGVRTAVVRVWRGREPWLDQILEALDADDA